MTTGMYAKGPKIKKNGLLGDSLKCRKMRGACSVGPAVVVLSIVTLGWSSGLVCCSTEDWGGGGLSLSTIFKGAPFILSH